MDNTGRKVDQIARQLARKHTDARKQVNNHGAGRYSVDFFFPRGDVVSYDLLPDADGKLAAYGPRM